MTPDVKPLTLLQTAVPHRRGAVPNVLAMPLATLRLIEDMSAFAKPVYPAIHLQSPSTELPSTPLSQACGVRSYIGRHFSFLLGKGIPAPTPSKVLERHARPTDHQARSGRKNSSHRAALQA